MINRYNYNRASWQGLSNPCQYQYKYFFPSPTFPTISGAGPTKFTLTGKRCCGCGLQTCPNTISSPSEVLYHDRSTDNLKGEDWNRIRGTLAEGKSAIRDHALKKVLPWRSNSVQNLHHTSPNFPLADTNHNNGASDDKFRNLVTSSNVLASHANKTQTWIGAKYSPLEWSFNNKQLCSGAEYVHNTVNIVKEDSKQCINNTRKSTVRSGIDTQNDLEKRLIEICKWTRNLEDEIERNKQQNDLLLQIKDKIELMIKNLDEPKRICQENLYARQNRLEVELVHDAVEERLLFEMETLRKAESILLDELEKINSQIINLRAARFEVENDLEKKEQAKHTDESVKMLSESSNDVGLSQVPTNYNLYSSTTAWLQYTQGILQKSQDERNNAVILYNHVTRTSKEVADMCENAWRKSNESLQFRISEIMNARNQIYQCLKKLHHDISILKSREIELRDAVDSKLPLLKVAEARLEKRKDRPGIELCKDAALASLVNEVRTIKLSINTLRQKLNEVENTMEHLVKTKCSLEHDLKLKESAYFIDREKCLKLRQQFPILNGVNTS